MSAPIAVLAAACEFPQARTPLALWQIALHGRRCFGRFPSERLHLADYLRGDGDADSVYPIEAALIEGYAFDRQRFVVPQSSYDATDLAHWMALDVADRALAQLPPQWQDDGALKDRMAVVVANTLTGEFSRANLLRYRWPYVERQARETALAHWGGAAVQAFLADFERRFKLPFPAPDEDSLAGALSNTIAGRIANHFGLRGGAHAVDGACASSLVAVITACEKIRCEAVDCVLVGAVDLSLDPFELVGFARNGALARGEMRVFDRDSNGFWPGEGCGCVILASQPFAQRRQWPVLGWIKGCGMSTDGQGGLTRPTTGGQFLALRRAWDDAALDPAAADYFEAHGTGTPTGDPVELAALAQLVVRPLRGRQAVAVGSIKANLGHTKAAAGMAGLIKALALVTQRVVPATSGCRNPHPILEQAPLKAALRIPRVAESIDHAQAAVVGVNSFGFGGVNCHVVLQGPQGDGGHARPATQSVLPKFIEGQLPGELIALRSDSQAGLLTALERVQGRAATLSRARLGDLAAACMPSPDPTPAWRACLVADSPQSLEAACHALRQSLAAGANPGRAIGSRWSWSAPSARPPTLAFMFPGQGLQLTLQQVDDWSRRFPLLADSAQRMAALAAADLGNTALAQALLAESCIAGLTLLARFGLRPDAVLGHSFGEISALHAAGAIDEATFRRLALIRGRAMQDHAPEGAMLAVEAPADKARALADRHGVEVACYNAARRQVLAGSIPAIAALERECVASAIAASRLPTDRAFHSRLMGPAQRQFETDAAALPFSRPVLPLVSTITGAWLGDEPLPELLARQFVSPVRFVQALDLLEQDLAFDLLIEVGAGTGPGLGPLLAPSHGERCLRLSSFTDSLEPLLAALGAAWVCGCPVAAEPLYAGRLVLPWRLDQEPGFLASPCAVKAEPSAPMEANDPASRPGPAPGPGRAPAKHPEPLSWVSASSRSALDLLQSIICELTRLPQSHVQAGSRLLADLHLNSIRARHAVAMAARQLGIATLPFNTVDMGQACVGDVASQLEALRASPAGAEATLGKAPEGVAPWARVLRQAWRPVPARALGDLSTGPCRMRLDDSLAPLSLPLRQAAGGLCEDSAGSGSSALPTLLVLPAQPSAAVLERLLVLTRDLASSGSAPGLLVLQGAQLANAFLRSASAEMPDKRVCVLEYETLDIEALCSGVQAYCRQSHGYAELRLRGDQAEQRRVELHPLPPDPSPWLPGPGDVVLISGGGKGIGAATAQDLGLAYGCSLALLGRSPANDPEVAATLGSLGSAGLQSAYFQVDLCDPEATTLALRQVERRLGPVAAVIHAAGVNRPMALRDLDLDELGQTLAAKVTSLSNLLAALDAGPSPPLRLLVGFASIIGEFGLPGEAHYALANEWLVERMRAHAQHCPSTRCLPIAWTAWREAGMAARLEGVLDRLRHADTRALDTAEALHMLRRLLESAHRGDALIVCGRYGRLPEPQSELPSLHRHRYLEWPRVYYPGIELVADAELSTRSDLYLRDHAPYGLPVFPLVGAIEAMVSAAQCLLGSAALPVVEGLQIGDAISCSPGETLVLRTAALVQEDGAVRASIRCSATEFAVDHFSALLHGSRPPARRLKIDASDASAAPIPARQVLYSGLVFHGPSLQRIKQFHAITARGCVARTLSGEAPPWYGRLLPAGLAAGDPALRDSVLHALQACIPQHPVLPLGAARIELASLRADLEYLIVARQTWSDGREYRFDIDVCDPSGDCVERWTGLTVAKVMSDVGDRSLRRELDPALLEAFAGRMLLDLLGDAQAQVGVCSAGPRESRSRRAVGRALGREVEVGHRADGAPTLVGHQLSISHSGELTLALVHPRWAVACDLQTLPGVADWGTAKPDLPQNESQSGAAPSGERKETDPWRLMLGEQRWVFARELAALAGLPLAVSGLLTWSAAECLLKLGRSDWPFTLRSAVGTDAPHTGPVLVLNDQALRVVVALISLSGQAAPTALALALLGAGSELGRDAGATAPMARPSDPVMADSLREPS